jgi:hypothetical protein
MITTAIAVGSNGHVVLGSGPTYGILIAILIFHGVVCSAATRILARLNLGYVVINGEFPLHHTCFLRNNPHTQFHPVGTTIAAIILLFVCSEHRGQTVSAKDAFTLYENNTGWANSELFRLVMLCI